MSDAASSSPPTKPRAKIFWSGGSQAVRLPKEYRFADDEVLIHRDGNAVILEPIPKRNWPDGYWEKLGELSAGLEIPDFEPMGGGLLDVDLDAR